MADPVSISIAEGTTIPLEIITQTNNTQFYINLIIGGFFVFYFVWKIVKFDTLSTKFLLWKFKLLTKRNVILIRHGNVGWLGQMIREGESSTISKAMQKFKGKPFDLILHTPGGSLFGALLISRMLKQYPGKITSIIPYYAMSGGTMLTLSTDNIVLGNGASLGAVDPQLGGLFGYGSANAWDKVMKVKGKKAKDSSIINSHLGKQATKTIQAYLDEILSIPMEDKLRTKFIDDITSGNVEHIYPFDSKKLNSYGIKTWRISNKMMKILSELMEKETDQTVFHT